MDLHLLLVLVLVICIDVFCVVDGQQYQLQDVYQGTTFFDQFNFELDHGGTFSHFEDQSNAIAMGLINTTATTAYMGTDYTNKVDSSGRPALQINSKHQYSTGLFILDASHMPVGCGVWPAWWLSGPNWPNSGEIDIIEGINLRPDDASTLHTGSGCDFSSANAHNMNMTGIWGGNYNCVTPPNGGCSIHANNDNTYGAQFNKNGGGVFAAEVNDKIGIRMWFWLHSETPQDILNKKPDPSSWKMAPYAYWPFGSWCTANHFSKMWMIFDLYYCGWSGTDATWKSECSTVADGQSCQVFVMNNPSYFADAYWLVNYVNVYQ